MPAVDPDGDAVGSSLALARALRMAVTTDPRRSGVASTKGSLELDGGGA